MLISQIRATHVRGLRISMINLLDVSDLNYPKWVQEVKLHLTAKNLIDTTEAEGAANVADKALA